MGTIAKKGGQVDMIHGPLFGKILTFSIPLIASGILQQSFNAVDVAVIRGLFHYPGHRGSG